MAGYSWTAPNPGGTFASASNFRVAPADIGGLVAAIMRMRQAEAQNQQNSMNQLLAGIGQGISGAYGAYQSNTNAKDVANFLQLQRTAQQSGTPGGYSQAMLEAEQGMNPQARLTVEQYMANQPSFMRDPSTGATIYGSPGRGYHAFPMGSRYGGPSAHELGVATRDQARNLKADIEDQLGGQVSVRDAANVTYGDYDPNTGQFVENPDGAYGIIGGMRTAQVPVPGQMGPWWKAGYGGTPATTKSIQYPAPGTVFPREAAQQIQTDAQRYQELMRSTGHLGQAGGFGMGGGSNLNAQIRQIQNEYHQGMIDRETAAQRFRDLGINFEE